MAEKTIIVGCRLPNGLTLTLRNPEGKITTKVTVKGMNSSVIKGATYTTTPVDSEFWEAWKASHSDYAPLKNGAIFSATTEDQAKFKGTKEYGKVPTGFEPMNPEAHGVKPAAKD